MRSCGDIYVDDKMWANMSSVEQRAKLIDAVETADAKD